MPKKLTDKNKDSENHRFASLDKYTFKERFLIKLIDLILYSVIRLIGMTLRYQSVDGLDKKAFDGFKWFYEADEEGHSDIIAFWHDRLFMATYFWSRIKLDATVMVSESFDGEYIARSAQRLGNGIVRGSSTRGGARALVKMVRQAKKGVWMVFTVDGPKGPRHEAKDGALFLARKAGRRIVPLNAVSMKYWTINSWDKTQIPKPFSKAIVIVGEPVSVEKDADAETVESKRSELEEKLDELVRIGKKWRDSQQ